MPNFQKQLTLTKITQYFIIIEVAASRIWDSTKNL